MPALPEQRLLLVLTEYPPSFGGMQTHAIEFSRRLHEAGHHLRVLTYRPAASEIAEAAAFDAQLPFPVHRILSRISYWSNVEKIALAARMHCAQLIYSSTVYFAQAGTQAGCPVVARSPGNDVLRPWIVWPFHRGARLLDWPYGERHWIPWLRKRNWPASWDRLLERSRQQVMTDSAQQLSAIAANSAFTRHALQELGVAEEKVFTLPGGVDTEFFQPGAAERSRWGWRESDFVLLTACRLVEKKGIPLLFAALAQLLSRFPSVRLAIAGDGPCRQAWESSCKQQGLAAHVHWLGKLNPEALRSAYRSADVFVLASRSVQRSSRLKDTETMGRVICEANACGLPVIAARSGGIPSVLQDRRNGLLFEEGDVGSLLRAIEELLLSPSSAAQFSAAGLALVRQEFSWEQVVQRHQAIFQRVLFP